MKTLDEVIKALEWCTNDDNDECDGCPYNTEQETDCHVRNLDALHYLCEYRDYQLGIIKLGNDMEDAISKEFDDNPPLTWISVEERMPENDEIVAIRCVTKKGAVSWNRAYWDGNFWHGSWSFAGVTHWMAIPILPEKEK